MSAAIRSLSLPLVALGVFFALLRTGWGEVASQATAWCIGIVSAGILEILQVEFLRSGSELRNIQTGNALSVTRACDGLGIFAAYLATLFAFDRNLVFDFKTAKHIAAAFGVIQVLNTLRVLTLFALLPAGSQEFSLFHNFVFPLTSAVVVLFLVLVLAHHQRSAITMRKRLLWLLLSSLFALVWYFVAPWVTGHTMVPAVNLYLWVTGNELAKSIVTEGANVVIQTRIIQSQNPLTFATTAFTPVAFSLAVPLVLASLCVARQRWLLLVLFFAGACLAMAIAATMQAHILANANPATLIENGAMQAVPYKRPSDFTWASLAVLQNTLVYFNLFVIPVLLLSKGSQPPQSENAPALKRQKRKGNRRG